MTKPSTAANYRHMATPPRLGVRRKERHSGLPCTFYVCLAHHSVVSKPYPMEGGEICAGCGIPGFCKTCCAVCTRRSVLVVVHPACCAVRYSSDVVTLLFPTATIFF